MIAKRSSRALALLLALPSAAFALGLGDIRLLSPLNAPLEAEIDLVDVTPEEMSTVQAQLASRDTFARYGLDWPAYLSGVQVKTVKMADGREVIKLKSTDPISDPFVTLLVEVNWARGKLVREYTMLLDPPVFTPGGSQVASAPVIAPAAGPTVREGAIARTTETPPAPAAAPPPPPPVLAAPVAAAAAMPEAAPTPSEAAAPIAETAPTHTEAVPTRTETTAASSEPAPPPAEPAPEFATPAPLPEPAPASATAAAIPPAPAARAPESEGTHTVRHGETLSQIAAGIAGDKTGTARTHSWMLAIYQANPRAFQSNMNVLHSGAVLRIPDAEAAAAISPTEAASEIRRQYAAWRGAPAAPSGCFGRRIRGSPGPCPRPREPARRVQATSGDEGRGARAHAGAARREAEARASPSTASPSRCTGSRSCTCGAAARSSGGAPASTTCSNGTRREGARALCRCAAARRGKRTAASTRVEAPGAGG